MKITEYKTYKEAEKLLRNALIIKRIDGNRTYYSANKEHPLYPEIYSLTLKTVGLRDILLAKLKPADIQFAFVFGSMARGSIRADSDIDLLVVMPGGVHRRRTAQLLYRKIRGVGVPFDILVATTEDMEKFKDNTGLIYRTILLEGKEIYAA